MNNEAATQYFRTAKGSYRHLIWRCANDRRSALLGDVITIPAGEVKDWEPCDVCCGEAEVAEAAAVKADTECPNTGVTHPRRISSACSDCGKFGKVSRQTGTLRAHKRA